MEFFFSGSYEHHLDAKNRIRIPAKLSQRLGDGYSITIGTDKCLWIMPAEASQALQRHMKSLPMNDEKTRMVRHMVLENLFTPDEDPQGRVVLPRKLIQYAGIEKEVTFIGQGDYIELWAAERYRKYSEGFADIDIGEYVSFQ